MHGYSPCLSSNGGTDGEIEHEDGWCDLTLSPFWGVFFPFFGLAFSFLFFCLFRAFISLFRFKVSYR